MHPSDSSAINFVDSKLSKYKVVIFSLTTCRYCDDAERVIQRLINRIGLNPRVVRRIEVDEQGILQSGIQRYLYLISNIKTYPNIFINGEAIGGNDEIQSLWRNGKLEKMIRNKRTSKSNHSSKRVQFKQSKPDSDSSSSESDCNCSDRIGSYNDDDHRHIRKKDRVERENESESDDCDCPDCIGNDEQYYNRSQGTSSDYYNDWNDDYQIKGSRSNRYSSKEQPRRKKSREYDDRSEDEEDYDNYYDQYERRGSRNGSRDKSISQRDQYDRSRDNHYSNRERTQFNNHESIGSTLSNAFKRAFKIS